MIDRVTLTAGFQVQRCGTFVAELGTSWIAVVAESAHSVAKVRSARGKAPMRGVWRAHADILSCRSDFAPELVKCARALPLSPSVA